MRRFPFELMGADLATFLHNPQLRLIARPQKHLLLQSDRTIDDSSPALRDSSDVEKSFEWKERKNALEKFFRREDTFARNVPCVESGLLCGTHDRDVSQVGG